MRTITFILGGRTFEVAQLPILKAAPWQDKVASLVEPYQELMLASGGQPPTPERMVKLAFAAGLFTDPVRALDAVCSYSQELEAEREWIGNNAYSDEVVQALLSLFFGLAAPLQATGAPPRPAPMMPSS